MVTWILFDQAKVQVHNVFSTQRTYSINGKSFPADRLEGIFLMEEHASYNVGAMSERELIDLFLHRNHDINVTVDEFRELVRRGIEPIDGMDAILGSLAKNYRLATAINEGPEWARYKLEASGFGRYFEHNVISGEIGLAKPNASFYAKALEIIGAPAEECLFIDDNADFCRGAERVGIASIVFEDPAQLTDALAERSIDL